MHNSMKEHYNRKMKSQVLSGKIRYYKTVNKIKLPINSTDCTISYLTYLFNTLKVPITTTIYFNDKVVEGGIPALGTDKK